MRSNAAGKFPPATYTANDGIAGTPSQRVSNGNNESAALQRVHFLWWPVGGDRGTTMTVTVKPKEMKKYRSGLDIFDLI